MTIWLTADWHLGHANIIRYCDRPFRDVAHMNEELIVRHNEVVKPDDTVIDVGDFSMSDKIVESVLSRLHGRRILVCGNHDRCFHKHKDARRWTERYLGFGFAEVHQRYDLLIAGQNVRVEHLPYVADEHHKEKYKELRPVDDGRWLAHGHVHGLWQQRGRMLNVGVDVWDYRPVALETIAERIQKEPT
jgi:calcineurin-like phosphoesterase family protein